MTIAVHVRCYRNQKFLHCFSIFFCISHHQGVAMGLRSAMQVAHWTDRQNKRGKVGDVLPYGIFIGLQEAPHTPDAIYRPGQDVCVCVGVAIVVQ